MVKLRKIFATSIVIVLSLSTFIPMHQISAERDTQPTIGAKVKQTLSIDGKTFKDLNGNGQLDPYENWQLSFDDRAKDLVSKMTLEEKAGLLMIPEFPTFEEGKLVLPNAHLDQNTRYFIYREKPSANIIADYNNQLQEAAEGSRLGIPVMIISNPRNHATSIDALVGGPGASGQFSYWPNTLGLAATRDLRLIEDFSKITANEFRATGIRKLYGYSADVATDPLWSRIDETFGEHPALVSDIIYRIVKGYQGDVLNDNSVTTTVRHYPGGGAREQGKDPHFEEGRYNIYPTEGSLLRYHMPPFRAAIEADTTSIMPYYAFPSNMSANQGLPPFTQTQQFEEVGFALNKPFINDYLRAELGFLGYVNSDTSAVIDKAWGALDLPIEERFAKALNAGTNIFSGAQDPTPIITAVNKGLVSEEVVDRSARYLVTEMMMLGLFENPYVEPQQALKVVNDPESQQRADDAHRKSIVLLRNDDKLLPLTDKKLQNLKLFVQVFPGGEEGQNTQNLKDLIRKHDSNITVIDTLEEATHALVWVLPSMDLFGQSKITLTIGPDTGIFNIERVKEIQKKVPTITVIDFKNPWLINDIEPNAASVIATFGVKPEILLDILRGKFSPVGKLPLTIPASQEVLNNTPGDIPGFRKGADYPYKDKNGNAYQYNFGLSY